ncbi:hypothetical protein B0A54_13159 [Friedmanniomyces endolithicus]|uniref:Uncharacterized protein n=1 Tax=Friedmanniomyces endolithicus TaxID=329885 RepID=A0A4U0UKE0_9PEZI|nr:hypothetical protein B0A54_13159 [Friedmanniomyces endolithicus]
MGILKTGCQRVLRLTALRSSTTSYLGQHSHMVIQRWDPTPWHISLSSSGRASHQAAEEVTVWNLLRACLRLSTHRCPYLKGGDVGRMTTRASRHSHASAQSNAEARGEVGGALSDGRAVLSAFGIRLGGGNVTLRWSARKAKR